MVLLLIAGPLLLPEASDTSAGRLDLVSVALSLGAVLPVVYGLKELAAGVGTVTALGALAVGAGVGVVFVRRQLRLEHPLLDLRLFRRRAVAGALGLNLAGGLVMAGTFLLATQWFQLVAGLSVLRTGLALVPLELAMMVATLATPRFAARYSPGVVMGGGLLLGGLGLLVVTQVEAGSSPWLLVGGFLVTSMGVAAPAAIGTDLVVGWVPTERAGSAGALSETSGEMGIALGVATLGSLATAVYRGSLVVPPGTPAPVADAARQSLEAASRSSADGALLDAARDAFTAGLTTTAGVGAALFLLLAGVAMWTLRSLRPAGEHRPDNAAEHADRAAEHAEQPLVTAA
jgi:DHA2 family multidrug resistance protein-like MFS transporter